MVAMKDMKPTHHDLEAISVRRANVADAGTVRYRVYSTPNEFVVVIADSALMAVKVSGVAKPYKIMRDLLTDGVAVEAHKMGAYAQNDPMIPFTIAQAEKQEMIAELPEKGPSAEEVFVPLGITELRNKSGTKVRILSPEMVNEIIEAHAKKQQEEAQEPVAEKAPEPLPPEPPSEPTTQEKMAQLAQEVLPSIEDLDPEHHPKPEERRELSKEEVERLLNG